ncbi:hypothetical protein MASR1M101_34910 [Gemmatimonas sp.]
MAVATTDAGRARCAAGGSNTDNTVIPSCSPVSGAEPIAGNGWMCRRPSVESGALR